MNNNQFGLGRGGNQGNLNLGLGMGAGGPGIGRGFGMPLGGGIGAPGIMGQGGIIGGQGAMGGPPMIGGLGRMAPGPGMGGPGIMGAQGGMAGRGLIGSPGVIGAAGGMAMPANMMVGAGGIGRGMGTNLNAPGAGYGIPPQPALNQGFKQINPQLSPGPQSLNNSGPQFVPGSQPLNNPGPSPPQYSQAPFNSPSPPAAVFNKVTPFMDWQYLDDSGEYKSYNKAISNLIETSYQNNAQSAEVIIDGNCYIINFKPPFSQYSRGGNGIEREVKRNDGSAPPRLEKTNAVWLWQETKTKFTPYEPKECLMIERAYNNGQKHLIVWGTSGKAYFIDLNDKNKMFQSNEVTGFKRKILRK